MHAVFRQLLKLDPPPRHGKSETRHSVSEQKYNHKPPSGEALPRFPLAFLRIALLLNPP
jgi:hypothetical protein